MKNKMSLSVLICVHRWLKMTLLGLLIGAFYLSAAHAESGRINLPSGLVMEYDSCKIDGDFIWLESKEGKVRLQKVQLSLDDQKKFFGSVVETPKEEKPTEKPNPNKMVDYRAARGTRQDKKAETAMQSTATVAEQTVAVTTPVTETQAMPVATPSAEPPPQKEADSEVPLWPMATGMVNYPEFGDVPDSDLPTPDVKPVVKTGVFSLTMQGNPTLTISGCYRIPMDGDKPAKSANNLVFYCPYPTENNKITLEHQLYITDVLGCSMVTFTFTTKDKEDELSDPKRCYWSLQSQWIPAVLEACKQVREMFNLENRKLILMGESAGSNMVQTLAVTYPDQIEAAAMIGGSEYQPVPKTSPVKWLVTNDRGDSTTEGNRKLAGQLKAIGANVLFVTPAPIHKNRDDLSSFYHHVPGPQSRDLVNSFIWGIIQNRKKINKPWPYAVSLDPTQKFKIVDTKSLPGEQLHRPDLILLPSAAFAEAWSRVALPVQKVKLTGKQGFTTVFLGFPPCQVPKGIIIYYDTFSFLNYVEDYEDIATLSELGYMVIAPAAFGSKLPAPDAYLQYVDDWLRNQSVSRICPMHLIAKGGKALDFLSAASNDSALNIKTFALLNYGVANPDTDLKQEVKELAKKCRYYLIAAQLKDDERTNKATGRLADNLVSRSAEKNGCKKMIVKPSPSAQGKFIYAYYEMLEKAAMETQ
jgi:dienelactone hydrolase